MKLKELAKIIPGEIIGNAEAVIRGAATIEEAGSKDLVFVLDDKFLPAALASRAAAVVAPLKTSSIGKPALLVKNPRLAMAKILPLFAPKKPRAAMIHKTAVIPKSCRIGKNVSIGAYAVLGENVVIGSNCIIHPGATFYDNVVVGQRVIIHSGARIGVDGFGFVQEGGKHIKIPQLGTVIIEDDVEIFANVCIARGTLGATRIGAGTKIDNLTHIAHNCSIGKDCAITALVGFAGSVVFGDRVYVGGQAGFSGHITVGENTVVMAKSGVTKDTPPNSVVSGFPAQDHHKEMELQAALRRLAKK